MGAGPRAQAGAGEREAKCIRDLQGMSESNKLQLRYSTVADVRGLRVKGCRFAQASRRWQHDSGKLHRRLDMGVSRVNERVPKRSSLG